MKNANENATKVAEKEMFEKTLINLRPNTKFEYDDIVVSADEENIKIYLKTIDIFNDFFDKIKKDESLYSEREEIEFIGRLIKGISLNTNIVSKLKYEEYNDLECIFKAKIATLLTENLIEEKNKIIKHYHSFNEYNVEEKIDMINDLEIYFNKIGSVLYRIHCIFIYC